MHDGVQNDPIQGQGHKPFKVGNSAVLKSYLRHSQRELAYDHRFLNWDTISKFDLAGFLIFGLVFVSRDFEFGRNVSCEESTVSPIWANLLLSDFTVHFWFIVCELFSNYHNVCSFVYLVCGSCTSSDTTVCEEFISASAVGSDHSTETWHDLSPALQCTGSLYCSPTLMWILASISQCKRHLLSSRVCGWRDDKNYGWLGLMIWVPFSALTV